MTAIRNVYQVLFIFSVIVNVSCAGVTIQCTELYSYSFYVSTGDVFVCHDESNKLSINELDTSVERIVHPNGSEVENLELVDYLLIEEAKAMKLIPKGVKRKFPNLKAIHFENCGISYLDKFNLQQFGDDLVKLDLVGNSLTFLTSDLFEFTQNLKYIRFSGNHLKFIESGFFMSLNKLTDVVEFALRSCGCIDQAFVTSKNQVFHAFKWNVEDCSDFWVENFIRRTTEKRLSHVEAKISSIEEKVIELTTLLETKMSDRLQLFEEKLEKIIKPLIQK